jgi:hypothetical protein
MIKYRPLQPRALNPKHQEDYNKYMVPFELSWAIVDSDLPSGGKGFKCQYYWRGLPIEAHPSNTPQEMVLIGKDKYGQT